LDEVERVYRLRYADFVRVAAAIAGSLERGRDAVHDAFVACVARREAYRGDGTVEAWLWGAVTNSARKARRVDSRRPPSAAERARSDDSELEHVQEAVRSLPERQRTILFLRYYADLDYASIARIAGVRPGTVGATLHAAQEALRESILEVMSS
jgi:RNA polymerase sigma factor (sigma-70 family)